MNNHVANLPRWTTAAIGDGGDTAPAELSALGEHVDHCNAYRGRWFALRCGADAVYDFVAGRFVTTLLIVMVAIGAMALTL